MASHGPTHLTDHDTLTPGGKAYGLWFVCMILGVVGLGVGLLLALLMSGDGHGWERFGFAYLTGYMYWLAIALGCLFFVIITHLFRAGWCVMVRRVAENGAAALPWLAVLSLPILLFVWSGDGYLYAWAQPKWAQMAAAHQAEHEHDQEAQHEDEHDTGTEVPEPHGDEHARAADGLYYTAADASHASGAHASDTHVNANAPYQAAPDQSMVFHFLYDDYGQLTGKGLWLQPWFFTLRWVVVLAIWCGIALWYRRQSVRQDASKDPALTNAREAAAPVSVIAFAFTVTLAAFDLVMSLDPTWYSTIFGVYYFANAFTGGLCAIILAHLLLQRKGLVPTVNVEHYHDLGKLLFAFVFFWGYIAYSQYVLIWYPSVPEIAYWFQLRGATTVPDVPQYGSGWTWLALILLVGHLLIPFAFLLSRHVKRNRAALAAACVWLLVMIGIDLFWLIRPVLSSGIGHANPMDAAVAFNVPELLMQLAVWVGIGGIAVAAAVRMARDTALVAHGDPRLHESLKLDTSAAAPLHDAH
ncbi:MAG: hypothetical protein GVY24_01265 [Planctomycetes bacterium]|nr:hypothetical protein [Planctomycetota bacterium]